MDLNIDFDEFKNHIQNRENAIALLGADRILMFPYRISGDILFEKNKITVSVIQHQGPCPTYIFERIENKNIISLKFKETKLSHINNIMFGAPSVIIILYLCVFSIPKPPPYSGEAPIILKLIIASFLPLIWAMINGAKFLQRNTLHKRIISNWEQDKLVE
tara:strand:+ start:61 stop:543 length:483 start_codon:yes stop_codon:yes gene_type:complete